VVYARNATAFALAAASVLRVQPPAIPPPGPAHTTRAGPGARPAPRAGCDGSDADARWRVDGVGERTCQVLRKAAGSGSGVGGEQGPDRALAGQAARNDEDGVPPDAAGAGRADGAGRDGATMGDRLAVREVMIGERLAVREADHAALFRGTPLQVPPLAPTQGRPWPASLPIQLSSPCRYARCRCFRLLAAAEHQRHASAPAGTPARPLPKAVPCPSRCSLAL
jgi:hypothetical protein